MITFLRAPKHFIFELQMLVVLSAVARINWLHCYNRQYQQDSEWWFKVISKDVWRFGWGLFVSCAMIIILLIDAKEMM